VLKTFGTSPKEGGYSFCVHVLLFVGKVFVSVTVKPDDGQYTAPKNVVVCTNLCENIELCSDYISNTYILII
jgi:hypothetical protein